MPGLKTLRNHISSSSLFSHFKSAETLIIPDKILQQHTTIEHHIYLIHSKTSPLINFQPQHTTTTKTMTFKNLGLDFVLERDDVLRLETFGNGFVYLGAEENFVFNSAHNVHPSWYRLIFCRSSIDRHEVIYTFAPVDLVSYNSVASIYNNKSPLQSQYSLLRPERQHVRQRRLKKRSSSEGHRRAT